MTLFFLDGNDDAYVCCRKCGADFDLSDFDLDADADHGDLVDGECPDCGASDCLVVQA